jgi:hypothetical protein
VGLPFYLLNYKKWSVKMKIKVKFLNCWQENHPEEGPEVVCVFLDEVKRIKKTTLSHLLNDALLDCYVHDGQFVTASYGYLKAGKLASKEEYLPLLTELYYVGYKKNELEVCQFARI